MIKRNRRSKRVHFFKSRKNNWRVKIKERWLICCAYLSMARNHKYRSPVRYRAIVLTFWKYCTTCMNIFRKNIHVFRFSQHIYSFFQTKQKHQILTNTNGRTQNSVRFSDRCTPENSRRRGKTSSLCNISQFHHKFKEKYFEFFKKWQMNVIPIL